jgi:hypothetical protein
MLLKVFFGRAPNDVLFIKKCGINWKRDGRALAASSPQTEL